MLHFVKHEGPGGAVPLVIAHGLFGSSRNWATPARRLSGDRTVIAADMRNHGASPWSDSHTYEDMADDLAEVVEAECGGSADLLGHSMGGKACMALALMRPEIVRRLVVVDIAPVRYGHSHANLIPPLMDLDLGGIRSREDASKALSASIPDQGVRLFLIQNLDLRGERPSWRMNLPALSRSMGSMMGFPDLKGSFAGPTLFVRGAESSYVLEEHRGDMKSLFPSFAVADIPNAGHWTHADNMPDTVDAVAAHLR